MIRIELKENDEVVIVSKKEAITILCNFTNELKYTHTKQINSSTSPSATLEKPKETNSSFIQDCYNKFCPHHHPDDKCYQEDLKFCNSKLRSPK